ncbi:TIM-barrel domain-containing protein [Catenulispora subtropica]|uniref:TIM-barrel domain-containing protein n=1 Tax=Catenulispora subtropica TaxID=450798 RepID=UPI0031D4689A
MPAAGLLCPGSAAAATPTAIVIDGSARFTVESPTLIRVEYAGDGVFQDSPTFTAVNRAMPVPAYTTSVSGGYRIIQTSALTLKYLEGSGPVNGSNLSVNLTAGTQAVTAYPKFPPASGTCTYPAGCEAEQLALSGSAAAATDHTGFTGTGFVAGFTSGAAISWQESVPAAGQYAVQFRYANSTGGDGKNQTRTATVTANGVSQQVSLPTTADWNTWAVSSTTVTLPAGNSPVAVSCGSADSCNVNIDSVAVTAVGATYPTPVPAPISSTNNLGGYRRALDQVGGSVPMADGVLSRDGWYLMDDTGTGLLNSDGSLTPRPGHGGAAYQDGYFFGYGHNYKQALQDLHDLTGPAATLPRSAFGVWFSDYNAFSLANYQNTLIPAFRSTKTPIDQLVADTDWKAPNQWDGWEFNPALFPDPKALFTWASQQNLQLALNIHPSIKSSDPQYAATLATAGNLVSGEDFDFRDPKQLRAFFNLHSNIETNDGTPVWWLDQSFNEGAAKNSDVSPDSWINAQYKAHGDALGQRGYVLGRVGGNGSDYYGFTPGVSGAWADHRSAVHFTGDTYAAWPTLAFEAQFTAREGSGIGEPYVSHDIGAFNGGSGYDDPDMYARWVQLGAFQPILRLHSNHGFRLPWDYNCTTANSAATGCAVTPAANYSPAAAASAEKFLQLREALVPYTYTLAHQATTTGLPIVRGLYLNYPEYNEAYDYGTEYTYGDDVLVAPVTTAGTGTVNTTVWFPPGVWTDYFTGKTYTGPGTASVSTTLDTMPVFLRAGGVMATRTDYVDSANASPMSQVTLDVAAGGNGAFRLFEDDGVSHSAASATTAIGYDDAAHAVTIGAMSGTYTGAVANRTWTLKVRNVATAPSAVTVNGAATTFSYDGTAHVLTVTTGSQPTSAATTIAYSTGTITSATGPIIGVGSGRCVDVPNGSTLDATQLQLNDCNGGSAQAWTFPGDGTIRALGKCMDVRNASSADTTAVQLYVCNGTAAQQWTYVSASKEFQALGKCLDAYGGGTATGTQLIIYTCHGGTNQQWSHP